MRKCWRYLGVWAVLSGGMPLLAQANNPPAKTPAKAQPGRVALKKGPAVNEKGSVTDQQKPEQGTPGQLSAANNYGRPWRRSQLDLRVGLLGGAPIPVGIASRVLEVGYGGAFWASVETTFIKLPKSKVFENTLLLYEFSFYKVKGTSVSSKIGQDTDADFVTNAAGVGKAFDVPFSPKFIMRFIPYFGLGLCNITSDTRLANGMNIRAVSGDVILKYGVGFAYDFNRRWQALMTVDHFVYFEEKTGMAIRINLGVTMQVL
ncbi:MAG: hypothetical protein N2Z22_11155 [Turneriella sp.]|nr:hypothetical protein [Turneriella sp.]